MYRPRLIMAAAFAAACLAASMPAQAQSDQAQSDQAQPDQAQSDQPQSDQAQSDQGTRIDVSVGLKFGAQMSANSEVGDLSPQQQGQYRQPTDDTGIYSAFGVGPGFGLSLEARAWEIVGLETGLYYMFDDATGWTDKKFNGVDQGRVFMDQSVKSLHVPLLLKINASTETIKPFLGLGFEFVFQRSSELDYRAERDRPPLGYVDQFPPLFEARNTIDTSSYTLFELDLGIEIDLGRVRIPVELRAGYNLGFDDSFEARIEPNKQDDGSYKFNYDGQYKGQFGFFTGVMYDYDFIL